MPKTKSDIPEGVTLEATVREKIRNDILAGVLAPNSKLLIRSLTARYEVGASPLREALSKLVAEGIVSVESNRGFKVPPLSVDELLELTEMRQILEVEAFRRSIANGDDEWESEVLAAFHRLSKLLQNPIKDPIAYRLEWEARHSGFHMSIVAACGNKKLMFAAEQLYQHFARYRPLLQMNELPSDRLIKIHEEVLNCVLDRDAEKGAKVLFDHFTVNIEQLEDNLRLNPDLFESLGQA